MKQEKKFLCVGGNTYYPETNTIKYIKAERLPKLYGVNPDECEFLDSDGSCGPYEVKKGMKVLFPRTITMNI